MLTCKTKQVPQKFMNTEERIAAFVKAGKSLFSIDEAEKEELFIRAKNENSWFTTESINLAFDGVRTYLKEENLREWTSRYKLTTVHPQKIALVMAGNIPLVGFHDLLSVLISGHHAVIKLSSKDKVLPTFFVNKLIEAEPRFKDLIEFQERLKDFNAIIATGSDNSARYFHYYFGKYPNIIRKNRTSCAVITGKETNDELKSLGKDVFSYFGLGCRNVSKIYIPKNYDVTKILDQWNDYHDVIHHHKYNNNYDYQKSILLVNSFTHLDSGFLLLQETDRLVSPIAVLYYERYEDESDLALKLTESKDKIQCVVGKSTAASVPFGQAQSPQLWDYADQVDTMKFLENLN